MTTGQESDANGTASELQELIRTLEESENKPGARAVLVVDDEPSVRRMVSRSMKSLDKNINVHEAGNGQEALDALEAIRTADGVDPVLIVTDLQMPVMDGWEFIERLRKYFKEQGRDFGVPVIVLSSSSGEKGVFFGKSVHGDKCKYRPLVAVAKEACIKPMKYDAKGEKGLASWLKYFLRSPE